MVTNKELLGALKDIKSGTISECSRMDFGICDVVESISSRWYGSLRPLHDSFSSLRSHLYRAGLIDDSTFPVTYSGHSHSYTGDLFKPFKLIARQGYTSNMAPDWANEYRLNRMIFLDLCIETLQDIVDGN